MADLSNPFENFQSLKKFNIADAEVLVKRYESLLQMNLLTKLFL